MNVDAFVGGVNLDGAIANVLRDSNGTLLEGFTRKISPLRALIAEAQALLSALKFLKDSSKVKEDKICVTVGLDSKATVLAIKGIVEANWEAETLILQAHEVIIRRLNISIVHCKRTVNRAADFVAKMF
ncbi:YqaJ domain-containing protein [Psidium guajava]|nr:YqaJ domain-containing protein [Psidium guajava]